VLLLVRMKTLQLLDLIYQDLNSISTSLQQLLTRLRPLLSRILEGLEEEIQEEVERRLIGEIKIDA